MIRRFSVTMAVCGLLLAGAGCSTDTNLGGVRVPNARPDTRITGQPPTLLEAGFAVNFNWTGSDPDGRIVGYEWKISDNGIDGISPRDTLTVDPLTGAVLHPWHFTSTNDTTFIVLADQADFPPDGETRPRSFRTHSIFVRAVDDKGAVDPQPALMSFTSTTIVPWCQVYHPAGLNSSGAKTVPPTVNIGWYGGDPDFELKVPTQVRFLWKSAQYDTTAEGEPVFIRNPFLFAEHAGEILDFEDPEWSPWLPYADLQDERRVSFPQKRNDDFFLFAIQVRDTAGAVSIGLNYQQEAAHLWVKAGRFRPTVGISEPFLGTSGGSEESFEIAGGQPINFSWSATANEYFGTIVSYRHGWDLTSVNDPNDQGWAVPPGLSKQNLFDNERSFQEGIHTFYLRVEDDSQQVRILTRTLEVIPYVDPQFQFDLLVIDQHVDSDANSWVDENDLPRNDQKFRNEFWHFLAEGSGGVDGINWDRDWLNHTVIPRYSNLVGYKVVLCYAYANETQQTMFREFRGNARSDRFVWMAPYVERGGNLFLVGGKSMESFLPPSADYMIPIIFDTRETFFAIGARQYVVGYGTRETPDGTRVERGPQMYPYKTAGIVTIDWTSPGSKTIYARNKVARFERVVDCVGLRGIYMDPAFRSEHGIGPGVVADTIWTEPVIDWKDRALIEQDTLQLFAGNTFIFNNDEFYDTNISTRSTTFQPQECAEAPGGQCVEPMWRGISRFDWMREHFRSRGIDWPKARYASHELDAGCGAMALTGYNGEDRSSSRTNGHVYGFMSYKVVDSKPRGPLADVYWGFDPYRFDHVQSKKAIRWVLQYFGLNINP